MALCIKLMPVSRRVVLLGLEVTHVSHPSKLALRRERGTRRDG
jgi:hypothetical protein